MSEWYYVEGGQAQGPIDAGTLAGFLFSGKVNGETPIWKEGMADWIPLATSEIMQGFLEAEETPHEAIVHEVSLEPAAKAMSAQAVESTMAEQTANAAFDPRAGLEEELKKPLTSDPAVTAPESALAEHLSVFTTGANWFYWIAGLTLLNAILIAVQSPVILALGLSSAEITSWFAYDQETGEIDQNIMWISVGVALLLSAIVAGMGWLANKGNKAVYLVGMVLIALDTLLFIFPNFSIIALVVHGYALYAMFNGFMALLQIEKIEKSVLDGQNPETV